MNINRSFISLAIVFAGVFIAIGGPELSEYIQEKQAEGEDQLRVNIVDLAYPSAVLYWDNNLQSYESFCDNFKDDPLVDGVDGLSCQDTKFSYVLNVSLIEGDFYCIDSRRENNPQRQSSPCPEDLPPVGHLDTWNTIESVNGGFSIELPISARLASGTSDSTYLSYVAEGAGDEVFYSIGYDDRRTELVNLNIDYNNVEVMRGVVLKRLTDIIGGSEFTYRVNEDFEEVMIFYRGEFVKEFGDYEKYEYEGVIISSDGVEYGLTVYYPTGVEHDFDRVVDSFVIHEN